MTRYKKPEPSNVRGVCCVEGCQNLQTSYGGGKYRTICKMHARSKYESKYEYRGFKGEVCEECGFIPVHHCQLDVDHIDGNHNHNSPDNLQTLCANCHRLKTILKEDYKQNTSP